MTLLIRVSCRKHFTSHVWHLIKLRYYGYPICFNVNCLWFHCGVVVSPREPLFRFTKGSPVGQPPFSLPFTKEFLCHLPINFYCSSLFWWPLVIVALWLTNQHHRLCWYSIIVWYCSYFYCPNNVNCQNHLFRAGEFSRWWTGVRVDLCREVNCCITNFRWVSEAFMSIIILLFRLMWIL